MQEMQSPHRGVSEGERQAALEMPELRRQVGAKDLGAGDSVQGLGMVCNGLRQDNENRQVRIRVDIGTKNREIG